MGVFGVVFGCRGDGGFTLACISGRRGDGGFNGRCLGASIGDGGFTLVCISGRRGVVGFKVAMSRVLCAKKFALLGLMVGVSAKKFAQRTKNGSKPSVCGVPGELFRENTAGGVVLGEVFRGTAAEQTVLAEFCRTTTQARLLLGRLRLGSNRKAAC